MISKDCPLIFTHIPKTGGMSLFAAMCEYHGMKIADMYDMSAYSDDLTPVTEVLSDSEKSVYAGHFPFGLHEWLSRPAYYMAIVRKPLDRIISLYYYSIGYREIARNMQKESEQSYAELFKYGDSADFFVDFLPWIKGEQTFIKFLQCQSPELDNGMVRRFSGIGLEAKRCPKEALEKAKENIERYYSLVGVQERYQDTLHTASKIFGVDFSEFHINKGVDKKKSEQKLKLSLRQRIKDMNRLDNELYTWVLDRFEKNISNPADPIIVPGGSRTDYKKARLWHAVGKSPKRQGAMELSPANR